MIPKETVDKIIDAARIEEVVGDFVQLRKRGTNLIGLCPFHNEKTPSFNVNPARNIFKCFGCGESGNSVGFVMKHEHMTFPEALRYLASKYNIEIQEEAQSPEQIEQANERESLYHVTELAKKFFIKQLHNTDEGRNIGLSYFKERGFRNEVIEKFGLGYSPENWDSFTAHALDQGVKLDFLEKAGLTIVKENRHYDRFRARVIFPVYSLSGRIIAFGGRILDQAKSKAKYINSPESDIYIKSDSLYGIYQARSAIVKQEECLLVEGYTDVISLHQAGIENVVASSGTSLTTNQIKLIRRYTQNICILYDGDPAGIKASFRGIDMILAEGMNVKIVLFPDGEDPDSFARKHTADEVRAFIEKNSDNFITFKTKILREDAGDDPVKLAAMMRDVVESVALVPDGISRTLFVRQCSTLLDMDENVLMQELQKIRRGKFKKELQKQGSQPPPESAFEQPQQQTQPQAVDLKPDNTEINERSLIRMMLLYGDKEIVVDAEDDKGEKLEIPVKVAPFIMTEINNDQYRFRNPVLQSIFDEMLVFFQTGKILSSKDFTDNESSDYLGKPEIQSHVIDIISDQYNISDSWKEKHNIITATEENNLKDAVIHPLFALKLKMIDSRLQEKQAVLKENSNLSDEELIMILKDITLLNEYRKAIAEELGRIIV